MSNFSDKVRSHLPNHYLSDYPKFVQFLEKYYEWLYRNGGISTEEKQNLLNDRSWLNSNIDRFIESGQITDIATTDDEVEDAIRLISERKNPGAISQDMIKDVTLERSFSSFMTSDGEQFVTSDNNHLKAKDVRQDVVKMWVDSQGFFTPDSASEYGRMDEIMLVRMAKHINQVKGTQKAAELIFNMFFDEDINLNNGGNGAFYKPKVNIFTIDEITSLIDDVGSVIRDDDYYNEFSYVIKVKNPPEYYQLAFEAVYLKYLHPAGFKVFLEQADPSEMVRQRHEFYRESQATYTDQFGILNLVGYNVPRYENNQLVLEQASANLLLKSIDVDSSDGWTLGANTTRIQKAISPFGSSNATTYAPVANGVIQVTQVVAVERNVDYALSFYLKLELGTDPTGIVTSTWRRFVTYFNSGNNDTYTASVRCNAVTGMRVSFSCAQIEKTKMTSFIPTFNTPAIRAVDVVVDNVS